MRRRDLLLTALVVPLLPTPTRAQVQEKVWRVSVLTPNRFGASTIRQFTLPELARLGFEEGRNLAYEVFSADEQNERLPALAAELVATKPDVIIAVGPSSIRAARAATSTIPIVMSFGGEDPVAAGWAQSYARPGGTITGVVMLSPELDGKRFHVLHEAFPSRRRIAVLFHTLARVPDDRFARSIQAAAQRSGAEVLRFYAAGSAEYGSVFEAIRAARPDALQIASSAVFTNDAARLAELAIAAGLPTICEWPDSAKMGCLLGYGPDRIELRRRTAEFIARIFRGTSAGELPIEDPTKFELVINLRTAKALGIEVPSWLLAQADEVVE
jgi:putative tryptophan/tyrosine transport system substrate-binding protein